MPEHQNNERRVNNPDNGASAIEPPTIAAAIAIVATWLDLSRERRAALTSSLRTIARIGETDVALLLLTPKELNSKILCKPSELYGISAPAMATVRSHVRYVMRRLKLLADRASLNKSWTTLRHRIPTRSAVPLTRFFEFHSRAGVSPQAVSDATFAECQSWIENSTLCRAPSRLFAQMRYRWNLVARKLPELALPILGGARCRVRKTVALAELPAELQTDLARLAARLGSCDLDDQLDEGDASVGLTDATAIGSGASFRPRHALRPITVVERMRHVRQAVWAAVEIGVPLDEIRGLRDLVVPLDRAKQIVRFMWNRAAKAPSAPAGHVAEALRQIAKFHVGLPKADVDKIAGWQRQATLKYPEMTEKNRRRLEALLTPEAEANILALPKVLLREAHHLRSVSPLLAVSAAKRALLLHLELFYPFRVSNVCSLRRDRHFIPAAPGSRDVARFLIPGEEVKNGQIIDRQVLGLTNMYIREWEEHFRPLIAAPGNPFLFPGKNDRPMCRQAIAATLKKIILERVRCEVNVHLLRHRAAVSYLKSHPGEFEVVRQLLGHKTEATARKSYTGPERDAAFDRFDQSVLETMKTMKPRGASKRHRGRLKTQPVHINCTAASETERYPPASITPAASPSSIIRSDANISTSNNRGADCAPGRTKGSAA